VHNTLEDCIPDALETVSARDVPDEEFAQTVNDQARLMAGITTDELSELIPDTH
jgi:hypothetical protein